MSIRPSQREIATLAQYNPQNQVIAIKNNAAEGERIILIDRKGISLWQRFLRLFHCGKLAHCEFHLQQVSQTLCRYEWLSLAHAAENTQQGQSYRKVCQLAGKALLRKKDKRLWECVSRRVTVGVLLNQHYRTRPSFMRDRAGYVHNITTGQFLYYNPICKVKHLVAHLKYYYPRTAVFVQNTQRIDLPLGNPIHTEDAVRSLFIRIRQELFLLSA